MKKSLQKGQGIIISDKEQILTPEAMVNVGEHVYFADRFSDGLFCYHIDNGKIECLGGLYSDSEEQALLYHRALLHGEKIYYIPCNSTSVNIYDITTSLIEKVDLPEYIRHKEYKFFVGAIVNEKLYLFGYVCSEILIYDLIRKEFICMQQLSDELGTLDGKGLLIRDAKVIGNRIYAVSLCGDFVLEIDAENDSYKVNQLMTQNKGYVSIAQYENELWLTPYAGYSFVNYNVKTREWAVLKEEVEIKEWEYAVGVELEEKLYVLPCYGEQSIEIDMHNRERRTISEVMDRMGEYSPNNAFGSVCVCKDMIVGCMPNRKEVLFYDTRNNKVEIKQLMTNARPIPEMKEKILYESSAKTLCDFINIKLGGK